MSPLLAAILLVALLNAVFTAIYIVVLRRRVLARFRQGFLYSMMIAMVGGVVTASTIVGAWGYGAAKQLLEEQIVEELAEIGQLVERQITSELDDVKRQLRAFGESLVPLLDGRDARTALEARLQTALSVNKRLLELHVYDANGQMIVSSTRIENMEQISKQAIGASLDGQGFVSDAYRSKVFGRQVLVVSEPLRSGTGAVRGAIAVRYDLQSELTEMVGGIRFNVSGYVVMVDGDGSIIAHPDPSRLDQDVSDYEAVRQARQAGTLGSLVAANRQGLERLFVYRPVKSPETQAQQSWVLLTEIDAAEMMIPVDKLRDELAIAIVILLMSGAIVAHQVSISVNRPLDALGDFAHKIGAGDFTSRVDVKGHDVAGRLATALNEMAAGLQERDHVKEVFGRYIATQVSDEILKGQVNLGGAERQVTVLFSDIRNFTSMSEQLTPQQVVAFLNDYFTEMVDAVFENGGVLDKFLGDGLMAVFGSMSDDPEHPRKAVLAALRMQALLGKINGVRAISGKPPIAIGIGIHTDAVIVGNIGSRKRLEYTVVGDGVNTSSRLQALNKEFGTTILISETTHEAIKTDFECRQMPDTHLRGKTKDLRIYEVVSMRAAAAV
jgi:class 3 adenylate cyclase